MSIESSIFAGRNVAAGDPWTPESAERHNAVSDLLNQLERAGKSPEMTPRNSGNRITAVNASAVEIPAGTPVRIGRDGGEPEWLPVETAHDESALWGVAAGTIPADQSGSAVLAGIVRAQVSGTPDTHATVGEDGLEYAPAGRAEVLWHDDEGNALLLLGGGTSPEYDGYFKVSQKDGSLSVTAGFLYLNGDIHSCGAASGITPDNGFFCVGCNLGGSVSYEIKSAIPSMPNTENASEKAYYPLAEIKRNGNKWSVWQISRYEIPQLWIAGPCEEEEARS